MKLLFVGTIFHQHIYNFSKALKSLGVSVYAFNLESPASESADDEVFVNKWEKAENNKSKIVNVFYKSFGTLSRFAHIKERFDLVQFHYIDTYYTLPLVIISKLKRYKVSCFVYGSDYLRASIYKKFYLKIVFLLSDSIVCDSLHLQKQLQVFSPRNKSKICLINFGSKIIDDLSLASCNIKLRKPEIKKINVMCGYNGYRAQNHLKIIASLVEVKDSIHLIIPMTYGCDELYYSELKSQLDVLHFDYEIFISFIPDDKWVAILLNVDVFIHMQDSDAFSSALAEHLFLGHIVINADWLIYDELSQNGVYYLNASFDNLDAVSKRMIENLDDERIKHQDNISKIYKLKSLNYCCKNYWLPYFESYCDQKD